MTGTKGGSCTVVVGAYQVAFRACNGTKYFVVVSAPIQRIVFRKRTVTALWLAYRFVSSSFVTIARAPDFAEKDFTFCPLLEIYSTL